jgi:hypothetical protein
MKTNNKNLVLISGATGSIGSCFFEQFILEPDNHVVGLSRSGLNIYEIPNHHSIVYFDFNKKKSYESLAKIINKNNYKKIIYIHAVGKFLTEINYDKKNKSFNEPRKGNYNKDVVSLTHNYTATMVDFLLKNVRKTTPVVAVNIGSLSDEFDIPVFQSWRYAQNKLLNFFDKSVKRYKNFSALTVRVSTILGANELLDRPFLFSTETDPNFWLPKTELVAYVKRRIKYVSNNSKIENLFRRYPWFDKNHWNGQKTFLRRVQEQYNHTIKA